MESRLRLGLQLYDVLTDAASVNEIDYSTYRILSAAHRTSVMAFLQAPDTPIEPQSIAPYLLRACQDILRDGWVGNEVKAEVTAALTARGITIEESAPASTSPGARTEAATRAAAALVATPKPGPASPSIAQLQAENNARLVFILCSS